MVKATSGTTANKANAKSEPPKKPTLKFPLTPHGSGKWAKKIRGKLYYFGNWYRREEGQVVRVAEDGWREALKEYDRFLFQQVNGHHQVPEATNKTSVGKLCNLYRESKQKQLDSEELGKRTFNDYVKVCDLIVGQFGGRTLVENLTPFDFEKLRARMATTWGPTRLSNWITYVRGVFKYGAEMGLIEKSVVFGAGFNKPSAAVKRKHRATGGEKMFTAAEIHELLYGRKARGKQPATKDASIQMQAAILLGINGAMINADVATLPLSAIDWKNKLIDFPRPKNGIERQVPLWPETVAALKAAIAERPETKNGLVFVTVWGNPWMHGTTDAVGQEFKKLLKGLHINGRRGLGFASLRHTFQTIADETLDFPAIKRVMGHTTKDISTQYRERIDSKRLRAVAEHVRKWVFGKTPAGKSKIVTAGGN